MDAYKPCVCYDKRDAKHGGLAGYSRRHGRQAADGGLMHECGVAYGAAKGTLCTLGYTDRRALQAFT